MQPVYWVHKTGRFFTYFGKHFIFVENSESHHGVTDRITIPSREKVWIPHIWLARLGYLQYRHLRRMHSLFCLYIRLHPITGRVLPELVTDAVHCETVPLLMFSPTPPAKMPLLYFVVTVPEAVLFSIVPALA